MGVAKSKEQGITDALKAKCNAGDQFNRFDAVLRKVVSTPKRASSGHQSKRGKVRAKKQ